MRKAAGWGRRLSRVSFSAGRTMLVVRLQCTPPGDSQSSREKLPDVRRQAERAAYSTAQERAAAGPWHATAAALPPKASPAPNTAAKEMTNDEFRHAQYDVSFTAGMNQRYHQSRASLWKKCDLSTKIAVGALAVLGAILSFVSWSDSGWLSNLLSVVAAVAAAVAAIALNVLPFGEWSSNHNALHQRWTDLREDVDALLFELDSREPDAHLLARLRELDMKVHRIGGSEPLANRTLLERCDIEERQFRGESPRQRRSRNATAGKNSPATH